MSVEVETQRRSNPLARLVTEVCAPAVFAALMPVVVGVHALPGSWRGLAWGCLAAIFSSVIPFGVIWLGVRRGQLTDHHIGVREQRRRPLVAGLSSVILGLVLLIWLDAPRELVAMYVVMLAVLLTIALINHWWKLSAHAAVSAGSMTVLAIIFGTWVLAPGAALVALIGWARVRLRDHTPAQVLAGATAGVITAATTFLLLR